MNTKIFLIVTLLISIILGSGLSYITVINKETPYPDEVLEELVADFKTKAYFQANELWKKFEKFDAELSIAKEFTHKIWKNESLFDPVDAFYHTLIAGMAQPADLAFNANYDDDIALSASAYKIAPTAFQEDYQEDYLTAEFETVNPLTKIDQSLVDLIMKSAKLDYIFKDLYKIYTDTLWLYMGFEAGIHRTYPFHDLSRGYDPRLRPWYNSAVTGAKDVVLAIDKSGSMEGAVFEEVKSAALKVIENLGSSDRFNVLTYSDEVDNFVHSLEVKSPDTLTALGEFLNRTRTGGTTNLNQALITSTELLGKYGADDHIPVILFLTDGKPTTGVTNNDTIIETVKRSNYGGAHIITFGIGDDVDYELMNQIASDNQGTVIRINETQDISYAMQSYTSFLSEISHNEFINWGFPIVDASGQGLIITASTTIYENDELLGVLSVDMHLKTLIEEIISSDFRKKGEYNFLFNIGGISLVHDEFLDVDIDRWEELNVRKPIEEYETDDPDFIALKETAKAGGFDAGIVTYSVGDTRVVALAPIGTTGIIYGIAGELEDVINPSVTSKLQTLFIDQLSIVPGVGAGVFVSLIIYIYVAKGIPSKIQKIVDNVVEDVKEDITDSSEESGDTEPKEVSK